MAKLQKAYVEPLEGSLKKQKLKMEVLFNPAEYNLELSNNFQSVALPGLSNPVLQFINGEADMLTMELFFDTFTDGGGRSVLEETKKFAGLMAIDRELHAPPPVRFVWGPLQFTAIIERISQRFTMFLNNGTPVRATLSVGFKEYRPLKRQLEDPRTQSSDLSTWHEFAVDDSLWAIAHREYGEVRFWRHIAEFNDIDAPRRIAPGTQLILPPLEGIHGSRRP